MSARPKNFAALRQALLQLQDSRCCYCGVEMVIPPQGALRSMARPTKRTRNWATIEHKTPRSHGGTNDIANLALACHGCNQVRGMMLSPGFDKFLAKHSRRLQAREENR